MTKNNRGIPLSCLIDENTSKWIDKVAHSTKLTRSKIAGILLRNVCESKFSQDFNEILK